MQEQRLAHAQTHIAHTCTQESVRGAPPPDKKLLEYHFVFACIWAFGGCMLVDKVYDYRTQFSKWWISEWKVGGVWEEEGLDGG